MHGATIKMVLYVFPETTNLNSQRSVACGVEEIVEEVGNSKGSCSLYVM